MEVNGSIVHLFCKIRVLRSNTKLLMLIMKERAKYQVVKNFTSVISCPLRGIGLLEVRLLDKSEDWKTQKNRSTSRSR